MAIAKGVSKKVSYKKEAAGQWGVPASGSGAKYLRRVTSNFNLSKEAISSNEIRTDMQVADLRHGIRSVNGSLSGELSPGSYSDFFQSVVARDFTTVTAIASLSVTVAVSGLLNTITRSTGSWLTDGIQVGNVLALTGAGLNVANVSNNILVVSVTALALTVKVLSSTPLVAEGPIATVTVTVRGKVTYAPLSGHTDDSWTVSEFYSDISQCETFTGNKVGTVALSLPTSGLCTTEITFMGKDRALKGTSEYFTGPTAAGTTGIFSSVSGALCVNGAPVGLITQMSLNIERTLEAANVIGQNVSADMFTGRIQVSGDFSTYFTDAVFRDYFDDEAVISVVVALTTSLDKNADVMSFTIPRVKISSAEKADAELGIIQSHSFTGLLNSTSTAGLPLTTILIQDSTA